MHKLIRAILADEVEVEAEENCGSGGGDDSNLHLRIASIFVILVGSMFGALFPVLARRTRWLSAAVPKGVFDAAKYFGSGVIVRRPIVCASSSY